MSHLIIEQGKEVGREVAIPDTGMKFGRSPANDLVLDDDAAMLFHGRFFFKSDGTLWVTDFGAGEKTTVGGMPVDEHPLKVGDLVEVGSTGFRIIHARLESKPDAAVPATGGGEIDLGFQEGGTFRQTRKVEAPESHKGTLMPRLMQVGTILLVLIVLLIVVPSLSELAKDNTRTSPRKQFLAISYERVQGDRENIFRYHLELDGEGRFSIKIDDLKNNRHIVKEKKVSETLLMEFSRSIEDAGFFQIDSDYAGPAENRYDLYDIAVQRNRRFHHIKVLNRNPPREIKRTVAVIEDFALSELGIPFTLFKDNAELMRYADHAFSLAQERYAEREVSYGNLAAAIKHYREVLLYLETIEPKPSLYAKAEKGQAQAEEDRSQRYKDRMFQAERARAMGNDQEAATHLRICAELVPERSDERHEKTNTMLLNVEQRLR